MTKGYYITSNFNRKIKYTNSERNIRIVLEAMESLENVKNIGNCDKGILKTSVREIRETVVNREGKEFNINITTVSRIIDKLEKMGLIKIISKSKAKNEYSIYLIYSRSPDATVKPCVSNDCNSTNVTVKSENATVNATVDATVKPCVFNTSDGNSETVNATVNATTYILSNNNKSNIYSSSHIQQAINEIWSKYPKKIGKKNAHKKIANLLEKYTKKQIELAIENYKKYVESQKANGFSTLQYKNGDTFFNSGIWDYIDIEKETAIENDKYKNNERIKNEVVVI